MVQLYLCFYNGREEKGEWTVRGFAGNEKNINTNDRKTNDVNKEKKRDNAKQEARRRGAIQATISTDQMRWEAKKKDR